MQYIFDRIHNELNRLKENYQSDENFSFNDGVSDKEFARLEKVLGFSLPNEFREIYRIHNGSDNVGVFGVFWFSIDVIINYYHIWIDLYNEGCLKNKSKDFGCQPNNDAIKSDFWFNPKWIPITRNFLGDVKVIDLAPSESGTVGQIVQVWQDSPKRELQAVSLTALFEQFAIDLENDKYMIDDGCIVKRDFE